MHIEPGVVDGAKMVLSYATAATAFGLGAKLVYDDIRRYGGRFPLAIRSLMTTVLVFCFFEVLPHFPVGVSEVHFILGTTLLLLFGGGAAAIGLALGLLAQGVFFAPSDLPMYAVNITTLLVPLFAIHLLAKRIIPAHTAYKDVTYLQALALSASYQGGIIAWVAFWAFYGQGFGTENLSNVASFGFAYLIVIVFEPVLDLAVLAGAKALDHFRHSKLFHGRLYRPAH